MIPFRIDNKRYYLEFAYPKHRSGDRSVMAILSNSGSGMTTCESFYKTDKTTRSKLKARTEAIQGVLQNCKRDALPRSQRKSIWNKIWLSLDKPQWVNYDICRTKNGR